MNIETAANYIPLGKATLFLGAGFSSNLMAQDEKVPSVGELSSRFAGSCGISPSLPLDITGREYLREASRDRIGEYVTTMRRLFNVTEYKPWHERIINSAWKSIYTTNYDNCVEEIDRKIGIGLRPISQYSPYKFFDAKIPVVHLHGYISDLSEDNFKDALLLTRDKYASYEANHKTWDFLQRDLERSAAVFFCGFSLSDWHIERVLSKSPHIKDKTFFILREGNADNEELKFRLSEYGNISYDGIEAFSQLVEPSALHESLNEPQFLSLITSIDASEERPVRIAETVHFYGQHTLEIAELDRTSAEKLLITRDIQTDVVEAFRQGTKFHLVHAEMGDGKTLLGQMILAQLVHEGWKVALLKERRPDRDALLRFCRSVDEKTVLAMLGSEISLRDLVEIAEACEEKGASILYCCRSAYLDLAYAERQTIETLFHVWRIPRISIGEFERINSVYEKYGLWGDMQGRSYKVKQRYILDECKGEFRTISTGHLHQKRLLDALKEEIIEISKIDSALPNLVIMCMLFSYLGRSPKVYIINKLISKTLFDISSRNLSYGKFNIIYIKGGEYAVPSSVFSREMLKGLFQQQDISRVIEDIFVRSSEYGHREFGDLRRELMQFGNLQRIMVRPSGKPDLDAIEELFQAFASTGIERKNIHFWQQYSITQYVQEKYDLSQKRLDVAKSLAADVADYDTFMLDHHQARLFLVSRSRKPQEYNDHIDAYSEALEIASRLVDDPRRSYERDTLYLSELLAEAFRDEIMPLIGPDARVREALVKFRDAVAERKHNASVSQTFLHKTLKDVDQAIFRMAR